MSSPSFSHLAPQAILATNSSSLPSRPLAEVVTDPERLLNMHFFAPVWVRTMVELMTCGQTSDATFDAARGVGEAMGLLVAQVQGESKGFHHQPDLAGDQARIAPRRRRGTRSQRISTASSCSSSKRNGLPFRPWTWLGLDVVADIEATYHAVATDTT